MSTPDDNFLERRARELFAGDVDGLDAATRSKLHHARQRALAELERPVPGASLRVAGAALASLGVAAITVWLYVRIDSGPLAGLPETADAGDVDIMLTEDDLDFLEDVEFIVWLEGQPEFTALTDTRDGAG
jgi:hypothetical protein